MSFQTINLREKHIVTISVTSVHSSLGSFRSFSFAAKPLCQQDPYQWNIRHRFQPLVYWGIIVLGKCKHTGRYFYLIGDNFKVFRWTLSDNWITELLINWMNSYLLSWLWFLQALFFLEIHNLLNWRTESNCYVHYFHCLKWESKLKWNFPRRLKKKPRKNALANSCWQKWTDGF